MFTKKFVSIYFSSDEIRVIELSSNKKSVKKFFAAKVPDGVITNKNVSDEEALSVLLKKIWSKVNIREKFVGIVIPEFSTFTKSLTVPKVDLKDLDEAIRWQSQDFLPWEEDDTVLDWKVVGEDSENFSILFIAVRKKVLFGYVNAVSAAGLFPIVVETPSLSLARVSKTGEVGKFIFYGGKHSSIFIIAKGENIIGSSVVYTNDLDDIYTTSSRMAEHYKNVQIDSVEIDGPAATSDVAEKLSKLFKKEAVHLGTNISGIDKELVGQFLIPLSLLMKEPDEPADPYTINLLPPAWVKKYETKKLRLQVWSLSLVISYIVWLTFFGALAMYLFLGQEMNSFRSANNLNGSDSDKVGLITEAQNINNLADKVIAISDQTVFPQPLINTIYKAKPEGVSITKYSLNLDNGSILLFGNSKDRASLILFKKNIEDNELFSLVNIPIAALEVEKNLDYSMGFNYLPLSAKQK